MHGEYFGVVAHIQFLHVASFLECIRAGLRAAVSVYSADSAKAYNVEKLERVFSALMGVVAKHTAVSDRTHLPNEILEKLNSLKETTRR